MADAAIFKINRSQAVRLPTKLAFPDHVQRVEVRVRGKSRVLSPRGLGWDDWFENGLTVTADFAADRAQPKIPNRESF